MGIVQLLKSYHVMSFILILITFIITYFSLIPKNIILHFKDTAIGLILVSIVFSIYFERSKALVLLLIPLFYMFYMFYPNILGLDGGNYSFWYLYPLTLSFGFLLIGILQERGLYCFYGIVLIMYWRGRTCKIINLICFNKKRTRNIMSNQFKIRII